MTNREALLQLLSHNQLVLCLITHCETALSVQSDRPHAILSHIAELSVWVCLHEVKPIFGRIGTDTFYETPSDAPSMHLRRDGEAEYGLDLHTRCRILSRYSAHKPPPAVGSQAVRLSVCIAPADSFAVAIGQIALYMAVLNTLDCVISSIIYRGCQVSSFVILAAPPHTIASVLIFVGGMRGSVEEVHVIRHELWCQPANLDVHYLCLHWSRTRVCPSAWLPDDSRLCLIIMRRQTREVVRRSSR
jgi:hypothetical protein